MYLGTQVGEVCRHAHRWRSNSGHLRRRAEAREHWQRAGDQSESHVNRWCVEDLWPVVGSFVHWLVIYKLESKPCTLALCYHSQLRRFPFLSRILVPSPVWFWGILEIEKKENESTKGTPARFESGTLKILQKFSFFCPPAWCHSSSATEWKEKSFA